jgi:YihY family inner membrane protein
VIDMSSVCVVPETGLMSCGELSADDAWRTARLYGWRRLLVAGFVRFRYGDGFSHARAFALQLSLAAVPLVIAGAGLATSLGADKVAEVVARTVVAVSPGSSDSLLEQVLRDGGAERGAGTVVVMAGLVTAFTAASSAFAQFERGANRIYGIQRDRPVLHKYGRAALLAGTAGVLMAIGLLFIVAGEPFGEAMRQTYHWGDTVEEVWDVVRWPLGLGALVCAVTGLFRYCPRRRQPGLSWLAVGGVLTVVTWLGVSGLLALYVTATRGLDDTYGPLTAMIALLLWANVTGVALLAGVAVAAQVEAVRAGRPDPLLVDSDGDGVPDDQAHALPG